MGLWGNTAKKIDSIKKEFDECCAENLVFIADSWQQHTEGTMAKMEYNLIKQTFWQCSKCGKVYVHYEQSFPIEGTVHKDKHGWYRR